MLINFSHSLGMCINTRKYTPQSCAAVSVHPFTTGTENGWPFLLGAFMVLVVMAVLAHPALPESPIYCYAVAQDEARGLRGVFLCLSRSGCVG